MIALAEMVRPTVQTGVVFPLLLRHKIQVLLDAGMSQTDVADQANVSLDTVRRVKREAAVADTDDTAHRRARGWGGRRRL